MVEIVKRKNGQRGQELVPAQVMRGLEPFRMMRDFMRWDPFRELSPLVGSELEFQPSFDVVETDSAYVLKADVPGVKEKDLELSLSNNRLQITGKREEAHEEKGGGYYASERWSGAFTRTMTLPDEVDADNVKAELEQGVLTVTLPKHGESKTKHIAIKAKA